MSYSHEWDVQQHIFGPTLCGHGEVKRSNIIKFQLQSQFQRFIYQIVCVVSQLKDRNHIERDFYSVAMIMPQGRNLEMLGDQKFNFSEHSHVTYQIKGGGE